MDARETEVGTAAEFGRYRLRGRQSEVATLRNHLAALSRGMGATVLIQGSPGIGKTRMLTEARHMAEETGLRVMCGGGDPDGQTIPFGALLGALHSGPDRILPADAVQAAPATSAKRYWLLQELHEHLERAALTAPLVIIIDDLQWCDEGTFLALRTLPQRLSMHPILWILAARTGPLTPDVRATISALSLPGGHLLTLGPLSGKAVAAMTGDLLAATPDFGILQLAQRAEGRPLLLNELINGVLDEGAVTITDGVARLAQRSLPLRFHASIQHRLEQVSPPARKAAQIASVLGRTVSIDQLAELTGEPAVTLLEPLEELLSADLLTESDGTLVFSHDLIREAIQAALPATLRKALRRQAVDLRLDHGVPVAQIAADLAETAEPGDDTAIALLRQAARDLAATAPSAAVEMSRRAIELSALDPLRQAGFIAEALPLFSRTGRAGEAVALAESALRRPLPVDVEAGIRLGLTLVANQNSFTEAVRQGRAGVALPGLPPRIRAQLMAMLAFNLALVDAEEIAEAESLLPAALAAADQAADQASRATLLSVGSIIADHRLDIRRALDLADQAVAALRDVRHTDVLWMPGVWKTVLLSRLGRVEEALEEAADGVRKAQHQGQANLLRLWGRVRCRVYLDAGRLCDARAEAEAVLAMSDELGPGDFDDITARYVLGRVALHTGDPRELARGREFADAIMRVEAGQIRRAGAWLAAQVAADGGDHTRAMELTAEAARSYHRPTSSLSCPADPADEPVLVRMALRAGDRARATLVTEFAEIRHHNNPGIPIYAATALHARALVDGDADLLVRAVERYREIPRPLVLAGALEDTGTIPNLDAALRLYEQSEAEHDAARVRDRLKGMGERRSRAVSGRPTEGWDSLTASELQIVRLVAGGATNKQVADQLFLSPHTVSTHLWHAFTKLGISSRVELTRLVLEHDSATAYGPAERT
ncbi:regulatory protein, luxR family [Streptosporangium subroseum]|uniref:Regulatory protein, luxR family n=1 Tax=Streptosporangium subroseum TaxID=106412 RepID=A0A239NM53_9ACTN|nr:LuxR family transcriptional regulator [Streptosporangium subroseum]SNT55702.1 regulatory protein, luxR family [Streptosporangium subroseum]